jgi:hypothetical protein
LSFYRKSWAGEKIKLKKETKKEEVKGDKKKDKKKDKKRGQATFFLKSCLSPFLPHCK